MSDIYERLAKIQAELNVPKDHHNSFGSYNYRTCEDIVEAAKPICIENGCVLILSDKMIEVCGMPYVEATVSLRYGDQIIEAFSAARETIEKKKFDSSQLTGSASSYARKYALNGLFAIDDTKDADTMKPEKEEKKVTKEVKKDNDMTIELLVSNLPSCKTTESLEKYMADNKKFVNSLFPKEKEEVIAEFSRRKTEIIELGGNSQAQRGE